MKFKFYYTIFKQNFIWTTLTGRFEQIIFVKECLQFPDPSIKTIFYIFLVWTLDKNLLESLQILIYICN